MARPLLRKDRSRPSAPARLRASAVGPDGLTLTWAPAHDDRGVAVYEVWRDGRRVARTRRRRFADGRLRADRRYRYAVRAVDAAGNRSVVGRTLLVRTLPSPVHDEPAVVPATGAP
ncbi:MAG: chitinase, partial [Solirubrobacterales bacterium]|nr:chitinase [Solirubrobacterales bacterium]